MAIALIVFDGLIRIDSASGIVLGLGVFPRHQGRPGERGERDHEFRCVSADQALLAYRVRWSRRISAGGYRPFFWLGVREERNYVRHGFRPPSATRHSVASFRGRGFLAMRYRPPENDEP